MNTKNLLTIVALAVLPFTCPRNAKAQLFINIDTQLQQYYLSGTASGTPFSDPDFGSEIFWDNGQAYDGGYTDFLSLAAFSVTGNSPSSFTMFLHGNGNVNGALELNSGSDTTLTGNSNVVFSYGSWAPGLIAQLEGKAAAGETVTVTEGSSAFTLNFTQTVPEPSSVLLLLVAGAGTALWRYRVLRPRG